MKKSFILNSVFCLIAWGLCNAEKSEWTIAVFMEPSDGSLHYWAQKNIDSMAAASVDEKKVRVVTQLHVEGPEAWRYEVGNNARKKQQDVVVGDDCGQNIIDFMQWVVDTYPAEHYALILWGHGFGIIDPAWQLATVDSIEWNIVPDVPAITCTSGVCPLRQIRGLLPNDVHAFLSSTQLEVTLKSIKDTVLKGNKLEILGTDCCKMAMIEIGALAKESVHYLIGSQNCELKDGWDYYGFLSCLGAASASAFDVAQIIVKAYNDYYQKHTTQNVYTLSALDLSQLDSLVNNFRQVSKVSMQLMHKNGKSYAHILSNARTNTPSMCDASYYLDLGSLYKKMLDELTKQDSATLDVQLLTQLKALLTEGLKLIETIVIANARGKMVSDFSGMSVYFPQNHIDFSYYSTSFAKDSSWIDLLQRLLDASEQNFPASEKFVQS